MMPCASLRSMLCACMLALAAASVSAAPFDELVVFGDSLSDSGNAYLLTSGQFPPPPYAQRFSNGPVAVEYLAAALGISLAPSAVGGTNYAVGGATTGTQNYNVVVRGINALANTGMANQVGAFLAAPPSFDPNRTLFVLWGGANDFFLSPSAATIAPAITNLSNEIAALAGAGALHIVVPNLPNLGATPAAAAENAQADLQALTLAFNALLANAVSSLDAALPADLMLYDTYAAFEQLLASPGAYGITNTTSACILIAACVTDPAVQNTFLFWDTAHPTTRTHGILGGLLVAALPEPGLPLLLLTAAAAALSVRLRQRNSR